MSQPLTLGEKRILDRLDQALAEAGNTHRFSEDVVPLLLDGRAQYWQHGEGVIVTELYTFPRLKSLNYWLVAGKLRDCLQLVPEIEAWARDQGASRATGLGRKSWTPTVGRLGFRPVGVAYRKEL